MECFFFFGRLGNDLYKHVLIINCSFLPGRMLYALFLNENNTSNCKSACFSLNLFSEEHNIVDKLNGVEFVFIFSVQ